MADSPEILAIHHDDGRVALDLLISPELRWFQGHFPGFPILPGVVQLDWAVAFAAAHLGVTPPFGQIQVKYKAPITAGARVTLTVAHVVGKNRLDFDYRGADGALFSSGQIKLAS